MGMNRLFDEGRRVAAKGRLFVLGDSFSTIRRTGGTNDVNGRFTSASGWNLWDWFRFSFDPILDMDTTTNFAREGSHTVRDWSNPGAWSAVDPIPSLTTQLNQLTTNYPPSAITTHDMAGILIGTNDGRNSDGAGIPTPTLVRSTISNAVNALITQGFRRIIVVAPERKYLGDLEAGLEADMNAIGATNRAVRIVVVSVDTAMREQSNPYLPDGIHPNDVAHRRIGEVMADKFWGHSRVDLTQNLQVSLRGSSPSNVRVMGFSNFDATATTGSVARMEFPDQFNAIEAHTNRRLTFKSYNGLDLCGAWESQVPVAPAGGGRSDPVVRVRGNFWEHSALIRAEAVLGVPASQSPFFMGNTGGVDRIKVANDGSIVINAPSTVDKAVKVDINSVERFTITDRQVSLNCAGTTEASPAIFGLIGLTTNTVGEFRFGDQFNTLGVKFNTGIKLRSYHGLDLYGGAVAAATPYATGSYCTCVWGAGDSGQGWRPILAIQASQTGQTGNYIDIKNSTGTPIAAISTNGSYFVGANQVVGARIGGWAAPTGAAIGPGLAGNKGFAITGTLTTAQITSLLIQLVNDLRIHGLIGT